MQLRYVLEGIEYALLKGSVQTEINHLTEDSRTAGPMGGFFCKACNRKKQEKLVDACIQQDISAIILEAAEDTILEKLLKKEQLSVIVVKNIEAAMQTAASNFYRAPQEKIRVIGVTGTKGKTTVSTMIHQCFVKCRKKTMLIGTNGVWINKKKFAEPDYTTPLLFSLYRYLRKAVDEACECVILEVSSLAVKQKRILGISFVCGIFTNLHPDHIGGKEHKTYEEYRAWKTYFLNLCPVCIINTTDRYGAVLAKTLNCKIITCSRTDMSADFYAKEIRPVYDERVLGCCYRMEGGFSGSVSLSLPGKFQVENSLLAAACIDWCGGSFDIVSAVMSTICIAGRCEVAARYKGAVFVIDYAHNGESLKEMLCMLREYQPKRLVCIFGCGGNRSVLRRKQMGQIGSRYADYLIITEDNSRQEPFEEIVKDILEQVKYDCEIRVIQNRKEAIWQSVRMARPGDFVLIAGKGHETYQEIQGKKTHFSDREVLFMCIEEEKNEKESI